MGPKTESDSAREVQVRRGVRRNLATRVLVHLVLIALGFVMMYPLLWMLSSSFKPNAEIFAERGLWPTGFNLHNYITGWSALGTTFGRFFLNSFIIALLAVIGNVVSCSFAAFAFARLEFRLKRTLFAIMMATIMLPFHVTLVPQYIMFHYIGWINTFYPIVMPKFLAVDTFFVFLMVQFIRGLPRELDDAATVDGCGPYQLYARIILPLTTPAIAVTTVFSFIWSWNDFFSPMLYLTSPDKYTVPVALRAFLDSTGESNYGAMFAMSVLSLVPILLVFLFTQKYLTRGISTTGMK